MQATRRKNTELELRFRSALWRLGLRYRVDRSIPGFRCRPDVIFPKQRVAVFFDSCFWHGCPKHGTFPKTNAAWWRAKINANRQRDARANAALRKADWIVIRVWQHQQPERMAATVAKVVARRRLKRTKPGSAVRGLN